MAKPIRYAPKKTTPAPKTPSWVQNYAARSTARNQTTVAQARENVRASTNAQQAVQAGRYQSRSIVPQNWIERARSTLGNIASTIGRGEWTRNFYGSALNPGTGLVPGGYPTGINGMETPSVSAFNRPQYQAVARQAPSQTSQFMQQMYQTPGVRRTTTRNFAQLPAYMQPGYVPGTNLAQQMPEKTYRKIFHQPMTVAMQTYPQGYAAGYGTQPTSGGYSGYSDMGGYGYGGGLGGSYSDTGWSGPSSNYQSSKGYKPYANDVPRWLQGLVTWRF